MKEKQKINSGAEIIGWYGTAAIVFAYVLVSFKVVQPDGIVYQLLNFTGAIGIVVISVVKKVKQSIALNLFWGTIAFIALVRFFLTK